MERFQELVCEMMKKKGVNDYEIKLMGNTNAGDGYMGDKIFFKVISKGSNETYDLLLKLASTHEKIRTISMMQKNFEREIYMYGTIIPAVSSFLSEKNKSVQLLELFPEVYWYSAELMKEAIIMENLKPKGFEMYEKCKPVDFEHAKAVLVNLAKWHGTVMALKDQNCKLFNTFIPHLDPVRYKVCTNLGLIKYARKYFKIILDILSKEGSKELVEKYEKFEHNFEQYFKPPEDEKDNLVISHGDLWINNVLFKHENNQNVPSALKFLDYQTSTLTTPIDDVSFFLYGSCDETVLNSQFDHLLQAYYSTLSETITNLGSNPDLIFSTQDFETHWKKYGMIGVLASTELIKLQYLTEDEAPDIAKLSEKGETSYYEHFDMTFKHQDVYMKRLLTVFTHYGNKYL